MPLMAGSVVAKFKSDLKGFKKGVGEAKSEVGGFAKKAASGLKTVATVAAGTTVAIAGIGVAVTKLGISAGKVKDIENSFAKLAENAGSSSDELISKLQDASNQTVANFDLMQNAIRASMLGIPIDKMSSLMEIARTQAVTMGEDVGHMLDSIVTGVGRASPMILDNLGITLKMGEVYENAADKLGKAKDEMTGAEKKVALLNAVIEWGTEKQEEMGGEVSSNAEKYQRLQADVKNITNNFKTALLPLLEKIVDVLLPISSGLVEFSKNLQNIDFSGAQELINGLTDGIENLTTKAGEFATKAREVVDGVLNDFQTKINDVKNKILEYKTAIKRTAIVLTTIFGPALAKAGIEAAVAGAKLLTQFVANVIKTGVQAVVTATKMTASLIAKIVKVGVQSVITGAKMAVSLIANIIKLGIQSGIAAAKGVASLIGSVIKFAFEGWKAVAMLIAKIVQLGIMTAATVAQTVATAAATAATWLFNAALAVLTSPITLVVAAIAALIAIGYLLIKNWDTIKAKGDELVNRLLEKWGQFTSWFDGIVDRIQSAMSGVFDAITKPFRDAWGKVKELAEKIKNKVGDALDPTKRHSPSLVDRVQSGVRDIKKAYGSIGDMGMPGLTSKSVAGGNQVVVNLRGDIYSPEMATEYAETIGDSIIDQLANTRRI